LRNQVPSGPVRLSYTVRGPELAVALPQRHEAAFDELTGQLCRTWNGVGTLLLPVDADGDVVGWDQWLPMLRPDFVYLHEAIGDDAARCVAHDFPGRTSRWTPRVVEREVHPWWLLGVRSTDPRGQLLIPVTDDPEMQRLVRVLYGELDHEETEHAQRHFDIERVDDKIVHALVHAQIHRSSPLAWSALATDYVECLNACDQRVLFIFSSRPSADELLEFWNVRARMQTRAGEAMVVGLPAAALEQPDTLALLHEWLDRSPTGSKPDMRVWTDGSLADRAKQALIEAGLTHVDTGRFESWSSIPPDRDRPEFTLGGPLFGAKLRRGLADDALVGLAEGPNLLHLATPRGLPPTVFWKGLMRVELRGMPIAFPLTDPLARLCINEAQASDNHSIVLATTATTEPLRLDIKLPAPEAQLHAHLMSCGLAGRHSGAGRIASTLLGRLPDDGALDALAHPLAPVLLDTLVAHSRPKLAQHVAKQLSKLDPPVSVNEQLIVGILRDEGLFLELQVRTLDEIASSLARPRSELLDVVQGLVVSGMLQRGRRVTCPSCRFDEYWPLRELDEQLTCRACRQEFVLPAIESGREAPIAYRLDGLMARVMDQDVLPVLLTLRHLLTRSAHPAQALWWPGLDLFEDHRSDAIAEIDLLLATDGKLYAVECKLEAAGLTATEAQAHLELADRIGSRATFGALRGEWRSDVAELVAESDALLLGPKTLLDLAPGKS
jgi:hypothetical protein